MPMNAATADQGADHVVAELPIGGTNERQLECEAMSGRR